MKKEASSEEKLLNLIRKRSPLDKRENKLKEMKTSAMVAWPSVGVDVPQVSTRILLLICLICVIYIGSSFVLKEPVNLDTLAQSEQPKKEGEAIVEEAAQVPKSFDLYSETLSKRDIFASPFQRAMTDSPASTAPDAPVQTFDLAQNFKIVGIVLDKDPKVIIEDVRNQRTLFLSAGDKLEGGTLEEIHEGKAIFNFNEQRIELVP